mmetsp:Transcript_120751/g.225720  ORF Transcript_120751/g.225720 Transcript_120751/m.225720 type:complete len:381 (-) Transcript_120751:44-1186(-)
MPASALKDDEMAGAIEAMMRAHDHEALQNKFVGDAEEQFRLAEAALNRRGNEQLRNDVKDANRLFDPAVQKRWTEKYRNFSSNHMKVAYQTYAKARHDPFNKDPSWVKKILAKIGSEMSNKGITPGSLFKEMDVTQDGRLDRPEVRRFLLRMKPDLSDSELAAVFNVMDPDQSNEIEREELEQVFKDVSGFRRSARSSKSASASNTPQQTPRGSSTRWRNPIHRIKRFPPAVIEGHDHLEGSTRITGDLEVVSREQAELFKRLGRDLCSPRGQERAGKPPPELHHMAQTHSYFGGGGDVGRFQRIHWNRAKAHGGDYACPAPIPDPGPDARPGYHILLAQAAPSVESLAMAATPRSVRSCSTSSRTAPGGAPRRIPKRPS